MKSTILATLPFLLGATLSASPPQVEITARYEGFDRSRFAEIVDLSKELQPGKSLSAPRVTTKSGQRAVIEIIREVKVPEAPNGDKTVNSGVTLDVSPLVKDGQITLSGKSVLRRRLVQNAGQPLGAMSFATHETFFGGAVQDGKELIIAVGDGPKDKARIILTVRLVDESGAPVK